LLGDGENEKILLGLLILFCKTDEKKQALKSCEIMIKIL
jgi:hypothetical protein